MSMNLALKKGRHLDFDTVLQTPTDITYDAFESDNPTEVYKNWVASQECYNTDDEWIKNHFAEIDDMLSDGYEWTMI